MDPGSLRECAKIAGVGGEDVIPVASQADHRCVDGIGLATAS